MRMFFIFFLIATGITSCKKVEGEGGSSSIQGKVFVQDYDAYGVLKAEYYGSDERVYIIYGPDGNFHNDDYRTTFDGSYRFQFLTPGTYKIFAYQDCNECPSGEEAVMKTVTIDKKHSDVIVPDLVIKK